MSSEMLLWMPPLSEEGNKPCTSRRRSKVETTNDPDGLTYRTFRERALGKLRYQTQLLENIGIAQPTDYEGGRTLAIVDMNGRVCPIPQPQELADILDSKKGIDLWIKVEQGFDTLVLEPWGIEEDKAIVLHSIALTRLHEGGQMSYPLSAHDPAIGNKFSGADEFGHLRYGGKSKTDLLPDPDQRFPGWHIRLIQNPSLNGGNIPKEDKTKRSNGRAPLLTNYKAGTALHYLRYNKEQSWTAATWRSANLLSIAQTGRPIDTETATWFVSDDVKGAVPIARMTGHSAHFELRYPAQANVQVGARAMVTIA